MKNPHYKKFAEYLAASYIAHRMRITVQTALKNYADQEVGEAWYALAEEIDKRMLNVLDQRFRDLQLDAERRTNPQ